MNSFFAYIFTAMTLFGTFSSSAESFCTDVESQSAVLESSAIDVILTTAHQDFPSSHEESDCHPCVGHNCHLGHCAFPMSSQISLSTISFEIPHHIFDVAYFVFDFQTSLFRPPIS